ncbi:putative rRNA methyltransferase YlbH [Weizmannia acidilactici]|uniref:rRNA methyltransferase YlbH n=1 Tax=Weizmannia acidilactici TaxID=2607726 RepID=A0A5J4JKF4_9BACI|nr:16S rRNA (guanine(966)-N(2))-methyltransferase RsmD [Weizmannia acidilactici]GER68181.1 putative rRNA methyltransferase YlbH [Weizmannia acidilactici]GER71028.1 putative rRNA methyltransferase YlbH [Weizmannia acidilactici]GER74469.1 putative rRNA methyltransferase YlbH [Weizmannia acidilactici]
MRVISGSQKGTVLKAVPGMGTRPTTDKVKEAVFNMIGPYFKKGLGLDLYAGSGGLGIEALSRGMDKMIFVDKDPKALQTVKTNLAKCGFKTRSEVYRNDAERALKVLAKRGLAFDAVFLDPPYKKQKLAALLEFIAANHLLVENGYVVCEHDAGLSMPENIGNLITYKIAKYGITGITIYTNKGDEGNGEDRNLPGKF